jgi:tetratricopeptide (TPR) repeat protein
MDLFITLLISSVVIIGLLMTVPSLVVNIVGQLLLSRPEDYEGWCYYGTLLERRGHNLEAYDAYLKSIKINPDYSKAHERLDNLLLKMQNNGESTDSFNQPDLDSI